MAVDKNKDVTTSIDALLQAGRLESIHHHYLNTNTVTLEGLIQEQIDSQIEVLKKNKVRETSRGEIRKVHRLTCRIRGLEIFRDHGFNPEKLIRLTDLTSGYSGKFLLVIISGEYAGRRVCLRSGDDWHHEILKNTIEEMADLGFENVSVTPAGGAAVDWHESDEITLYGTSEAYGSCDMQLAKALITKAFPNKTIRIQA